MLGHHPTITDEPNDKITQSATGDYIAQAAPGGTATVNATTIVQKFFSLFAPSTTDPQRAHNREVMLGRVRKFWVQGVLENSLHNAVLIELGMEQKPAAVDYPWEMVLQRPDQPNHRLPSGAKIMDVFDQAGHALLILGEPGSGKTTMLLELTRQTITCAQANPGQPMPVVFNLSSWAEKRPPLAGWLVEELRTKYNIPKKLAQVWVDNGELLLLLDGLDEVALPHRAACVEAINAFHKDNLMPLVVCSRVADYEALSTKLNLQQAILLQPLTEQQVADYLAHFGPELDTLRTALQDDPTLQELAVSPLMLSIMTLAYRDSSVEELRALDSPSARRQHLFETYVNRMFQRRGADQAYPPEQTIRWLTWLAQKMSEHVQTIFLIERMQPGWLHTATSQRLYSIIDRVLFGLIGGGISGLVSGLIFPSTELIFGIGGILLGVLLGGLGGEIEPIEVLTWSWKPTRNNLLPSNFRLLLATYGMIVGIGAWIVFGVYGLVLGLFAGVLLGFFIMLIIGLLKILINLLLGLDIGEIGSRLTPNQGIWQSAKNGMIAGLIIWTFVGLAAIGVRAITPKLIPELAQGLFLWLTCGVIIVLFFGGIAFIEHFTLRLILYHTDQLPWRLVPFLDYCAGRILLRKVGGGYIFIHRYLLEYFASLEPESVSSAL